MNLSFLGIGWTFSCYNCKSLHIKTENKTHTHTLTHLTFVSCNLVTELETNYSGNVRTQLCSMSAHLINYRRLRANKLTSSTLSPRGRSLLLNCWIKTEWGIWSSFVQQTSRGKQILLLHASQILSHCKARRANSQLSSTKRTVRSRKKLSLKN